MKGRGGTEPGPRTDIALLLPDLERVALELAMTLFRTTGLAFAGLVVIGAMAIGMYELFAVIEKRTTGWAHQGMAG
jgi:hypothetical protein